MNVNTISTGNLVINSINTPQIQVSTLQVGRSIICSPNVSTLSFTTANIDN
jgi:hypothetical protein